jgi:hypothetical protein
MRDKDSANRPATSYDVFGCGIAANTRSDCDVRDVTDGYSALGD